MVASLKLKVRSVGVNEAFNKIYRITERQIEIPIGKGLEIAGQIVSQEMNLREQYANEAEWYKIDNMHVVVGASPERLLEVMDVPQWYLYEGRRRCIWLEYERFIMPHERVPVTDMTRAEIHELIESVKPMIRDAIVEEILEALR